MNKQIEEMAEYLIEIQRNFDEYCAKPCRDCELGGVVNCESHYKAEALYEKGYRKSTDVAREIFAEIEYLIWQYDTHPASDLTERIVELKEKYESEGADDEISRES